MAFNLKKFQNEEDYNAAELNYPAVSWILSGDTVVYDKTEPTPPEPAYGGLTVKYYIADPSVAWIVSGDTFHYDKEEPQPEPAYGGLTVKYYIADPSVEVTLFNGGGASSSGSDSESDSGSGGGAMPTTMIVDGVEETPINTWRFETSGEHTVQYAFENNVINVSFYGINEITEVVVGDDITEIASLTSNGVFYQCTGLTSVTIGSGITKIGENAFGVCRNLTSVTINATYPPVLEGGNAFTNTNNCPIYVPSGSVDEYMSSTSTGWSVYASRIQAIQ